MFIYVGKKKEKEREKKATWGLRMAHLSHFYHGIILLQLPECIKLFSGASLKFYNPGGFKI